jgi:NAD-dependent SIR2 family protein deacetylase
MVEEQKDMRIPTGLIPKCPVCGEPMTMNLRSDDKFVEDEGWHEAVARYENFLRTRKGKVLFLELGVGYNTPVIIKYPFWQMTANNPDATYACINYAEAVCTEMIKARAICIEGDIGEVLNDLKMKK